MPFQNLESCYRSKIPKLRQQLSIWTDTFSVILGFQDSLYRTMSAILSLGFLLTCFWTTHKWIIFTSPHYPNPSHAKRENGNLKLALRIFHSQDHTAWDTNLHWFQLAFNSSWLESTKLSPSTLLLGRQIPLTHLPELGGSWTSCLRFQIFVFNNKLLIFYFLPNSLLCI